MLLSYWKVCAVMINKINDILKKEYPDELTDKLLEAYYNSIIEYKKRKWQYFGNEVGRFIEIAIRLVEFKNYNSYTKLEDKLPIFNESRLKQFEQSQNNANVSFKILIPRQLFSMYTIRNKRGMIHVNDVDPNYMDANVLLGMSKWVLSEFVRNTIQLEYDDAVKLIESITTKENILVWEDGDIFKILNNKIKIEDKIMCILYFKNNISSKELFKYTEYSNYSIFKKKLSIMHKEQMLNYTEEKVTISPIGVNIAESVLNDIRI